MGYDSYSPSTTKTRLTAPLNGTLFTTTRPVASEKPLPALGISMSTELGDTYAASKVVAVTDGPDRSKGILTITHASIPSEAEQLVSNWERMLVPIGIGQADGVVRTVIIPAADYNDASPAKGSAMPVVTGGLFSGGGYILYDRDAVNSGTSLEPVFRVEKRTYVQRHTVVQNDYDEALGGNLQTIQSLYYRGESCGGSAIETVFADDDSSFWGLQSDGWVREGKQLTPDWFCVISKQVVPSGFATSGRTYNTTINYSWPGVLSNIGVSSWPLREGGLDSYPVINWSKYAYSGDCKATIVETFHIAPQTVSAPTAMLPLPILIQSPFFSVAIPASLHTTINFSITSGTNHPRYDYAGGNYVYSSTSPTNWPNSVIASDTVSPFRGGYLRRTITVYPPT